MFIFSKHSSGIKYVLTFVVSSYLHFKSSALNHDTFLEFNDLYKTSYLECTDITILKASEEWESVDNMEFSVLYAVYVL